MAKAQQTTPALASLDRVGRVIHIGSFSKTLTPTLGLGFVVARAVFGERELVDLTIAISVMNALQPQGNQFPKCAASCDRDGGLRKIEDAKAGA